jgi:hypothetical protein
VVLLMAGTHRFLFILTVIFRLFGTQQNWLADHETIVALHHIVPDILSVKVRGPYFECGLFRFPVGLGRWQFRSLHG